MTYPIARYSGAGVPSVLHIPPMPVIGSLEPDSIYLGRLMVDGMPANRVNFGGETHVLTLGVNGTRKGMGLLVPNLLSNVGKSILCLDPKGQNCAMTAAWRHRAGNAVKILDPLGVLKDLLRHDPYTYAYLAENNLIESCGFNPLAALDTKSPRFFDDVRLLSEALITMTGEEKQPHFPRSARSLMTALIMWECKRNGRAANLENVRAMLTAPDVWESFTDKKGKKKQGLVSSFAALMRQMVEEGGFEIASLAGRFATDRPNEELEGIRSDAITQTEWLLSEDMRTDLKKDGIDFRQMKSGARPLTIYAILPANMLEIEAQGVWLRLVLSEALRANMNGGGRRCLCICDEFPAMSNLALVERLFAVMRDYRIQMWIVAQSLEMLQKHYPKSWQTMLAQCGVKQSFRCGDWTTAEYLAKLAGTDTAVAASYNSTTSRSGSGAQSSWSVSDTMSFAQVAVPYLRPEELLGLPTGEMIGYVAGIRSPVPFYAPMYFDSAIWEKRALPNPYYGR